MLSNLHPNAYSQEFHYYPFLIKLNRCVGSCNTLNDLSNEVCTPNKTEDINLSVFNVVTGWNESKTLLKTKTKTNHKQRIYHLNVNISLMEKI